MAALTIRSLFDPGKDIYRPIEKVITYGVAQEPRLKAEVSEYIVTASMEEQFHKLLDRMKMAMDDGGGNEIGVWVSGFYGSGKSSFTKYFGMALDSDVTVEGTPFLTLLQNRLNTTPVKQQLSTLAQRFPAAVVMLDLASEMLAGATMEDVSTVLYYKVLQWAGYSHNLKVAALERRMEGDGRYDEFLAKIERELPGVAWKELQNDPLSVDELIPRIAHEMYPALFSTPSAFSTSTEGFIQFENQRVKEMIDIVREKSGKQHILFVVDEVGQYLGARDNLILNLDGLAKNLKSIGDGKAWIMATAQQTLTEDDPRAAINSDKLYKLKDRFPIQVDLESHDIKEICYKRLLGKSPAGEAELSRLFDLHGQALRQNTRLQDAKYYDSDFDRTTFVNLYPFLPAHFDILLQLLGALAKSTGGVGLRSAIKVVQDVLVTNQGGSAPAGDQPVGWLATLVTLYDTLEKDIRKAFPSIHYAVGQTCVRFPDLPLHQTHQEAAKSIAILQILGNLPVTAQNVASLMHPAVDAPSQRDAVRQAIEAMLSDPLVPLGDKDGSLSFLSEKLRDIEQERGALALRGVEVRRIFNEALRDGFDPLPRASLHNTLTVTAGLKVQTSAALMGLAGENNPIQMVIEFAPTLDYEAVRARALDDSRGKAGQSVIYVLGRDDPQAERLAEEIYRCQRIVELHRNEPDPEVKDYCVAQTERAAKLARDLKARLKQALQPGSFLFRGQTTAVATLDGDVGEAAKKILADAAERVFERYGEAPVRVETTHAEKFLRAGSPTAITSALDPLGLVGTGSKGAVFNTGHKALVSLRDYIDKSGMAEGKRLLEYFGDAPFGWSPDTTRYLLAVLLSAGEITLKVSGRAVTTVGQQAIDALKTNNSFKTAGVSLRNDRPSNEECARAAERLTELTGDMVIPLEQEISKATAKHFPRFQGEAAPLAERLSALDVAGSERARGLAKDIADVLQTDASDATKRLGGAVSALYEDLKWAREARRTLDNGLAQTLKQLQEHRREIAALPDVDIPGELRQELAPALDGLKLRLQTEDFYCHAPNLNTLLTDVQAAVKNTVGRLEDAQQARRKEGAQALQRLPEWKELTQEEQSNVAGALDSAGEASRDLKGLKQLLRDDYELNAQLSAQAKYIAETGRLRKRNRVAAGAGGYHASLPEGVAESVALPARLTSPDDLDALIQQLQGLRAQLNAHPDIAIALTITE